MLTVAGCYRVEELLLSFSLDDGDTYRGPDRVTLTLLGQSFVIRTCAPRGSYIQANKCLDRCEDQHLLTLTDSLSSKSTFSFSFRCVLKLESHRFVPTYIFLEREKNAGVVPTWDVSLVSYPRSGPPSCGSTTLREMNEKKSQLPLYPSGCMTWSFILLVSLLYIKLEPYNSNAWI